VDGDAAVNLYLGRVEGALYEVTGVADGEELRLVWPPNPYDLAGALNP
jgi:hypothetical protein